MKKYILTFELDDYMDDSPVNLRTRFHDILDWYGHVCNCKIEEVPLPDDTAVQLVKIGGTPIVVDFGGILQYKEARGMFGMRKVDFALSAPYSTEDMIIVNVLLNHRLLGMMIWRPEEHTDLKYVPDDTLFHSDEYTDTLFGVLIGAVNEKDLYKVEQREIDSETAWELSQGYEVCDFWACIENAIRKNRGLPERV